MTFRGWGWLQVLQLNGQYDKIIYVMVKWKLVYTLRGQSVISPGMMKTVESEVRERKKEWKKNGCTI